jgi:dihydropyrimidinase
MSGCLVVRGGTVVTPAETRGADVLVEDGRIAAVGPSVDVPDGVRVIDASGCYVIPGAVDPHTHLDSPVGQTFTSDDYESGTLAAIVGGTTTIINFVPQIVGRPLAHTIDTWVARADGKAVVDHGIHLALRQVDDGTIAELPDLMAGGVTSVKVYMAYPGDLMLDDASLLRVLEATVDGGLCCIHAENGMVIDALQRRVPAQHRAEVIWHARTRPDRTESEAVHRAASLAALAKAPAYFVHLSSSRAVDELRRSWPTQLYAETCTHYLLLDESRYEAAPEQAARYVMSPPLRTAQDQDRLWDALDRGDLQVVSSDHCPTCVADKLALGGSDFARMPNGGAGIEHRLALVHTHGVVTGRMTLARWVDVCTTTPAKLFGLYPRKGAIAVGSDADIVVFDPEARSTVGARSRYARVDHELFEGFPLVGAVRSVVAGGELAVESGRFVGTPGRGRYLRRGPSGHA